MRSTAQLDSDAPLAIAWEECACLLCGGGRPTPLLEAPDVHTGLRFLIARCNRCGLSFTNPRPDPSAIDAFYPIDYACHQSKERPARVDSMCKLLPIVGQARLLDFGCGAGAFLQRMSTRGWNVTGLDASENAVAQVRARGLSAQVGTLPCEHWPEASFEAITMRQSLEHTHQPVEVLRAAARLLTTDGRLIVAVPNFESVAAQTFGPDWYGLDVPRHLIHFTPATLRLMLHRAGFTHVEIRQESHASWIRHSAELAERRQHRNRFTRLMKTRVGSTLASWWAALNGRSESILAIAART